MNNVYIGARYVPKFDGDYDSTKTYEPLTIVNWNGASYTSKRTVPAGTLPSDGNYWAMTGNYNGQIAYLQSEIDNVTGRVDTLDTKVNKISTKKNVLLVGDSYAEGIGGAGTTIESVLKSHHSWNVTTFAEGGCGYLRYNDSNHRAYEVLNNGIAGMNDTEKALITDVVLCCSAYNDMGRVGQPDFTENGFKTALNEINTLVKNELVNANVTVIPALWVDVTYNTDYIKIWEWTKAGAQSIGANYAKNSINWLMTYGNSVNSGDNIHPSAFGYTIIADHIATVLNGAEPALYNGIDLVTTATNDVLTIKYYDDYATITGFITKEAGQTFNSLFDVPQPLSKLMNHPIIVNKYGARDVFCISIIGTTCYCGSDWLDDNVQYRIDVKVPYVNFT